MVRPAPQHGGIRRVEKPGPRHGHRRRPHRPREASPGTLSPHRPWAKWLSRRAECARSQGFGKAWTTAALQASPCGASLHRASGASRGPTAASPRMRRPRCWARAPRRSMLAWAPSLPAQLVARPITRARGTSAPSWRAAARPTARRGADGARRPGLSLQARRHAGAGPASAAGRSCARAQWRTGWSWLPYFTVQAPLRTKPETPSRLSCSARTPRAFRRACWRNAA
mmetsp:Transcript_52223/g.167392  ORF Transcript_52223/g.167392 Transcript_52223/m.167392 type:complete len:227 (+) Transcript_52223:123-803(+)